MSWRRSTRTILSRLALVAALAGLSGSILAAAPGCREVEVTGPRLMTVGGAGRPVALAFGSGVWRWADLL